jgi:hypothetical protein
MTTRAWAWSPWTLAAVITVACPAAATAQEDQAPPGVIVGQVLAAETDAPLAGAVIRLVTPPRFAFTDRHGAFALTGLSVGVHLVLVEQLGYETAAESWIVSADDESPRSVVVRLVPRPIVLEGLHVQVSRLDDRTRALAVPVRIVRRERITERAMGNARDAVFHLGYLAATQCAQRPGMSAWDWDCVRIRGRTVRPEVWIDERRAIDGLAELATYAAHDLQRIEVIAGGRQVRVYTTWFMEHVASRPGYRPMPILQ